MTDVPASTAFERYRDVRFFGSLNGLRVLCVFMVMWHHSPARGSMDDRMQLLNTGYTGVDFFFVLSGFLITTLLLREESRFGRFSLPDFYWRRLLRIVPVYFLLVTGVAGYYIVIKGQAEYIGLLPYYYLFLSNFLTEGIGLLSITWSLAVEEQYYLFWPALLLVLPITGRVRGWVLVGLICIFVLGAIWGIGGIGRTENPPLLMRVPLSSYAGLLIGSLLGWVLHRPRGFAALYGLLWRPWTPIAAFLGLGLLLQFYPGPLWGFGNLLVHSTMALCLASLVVRGDHVLHPLLAWRPIARVGEISYGIYLFHLIGLHVAGMMMQRFGAGLSEAAQPWVLSLGMVVLTLIIAEISFRTFESYFLRFKHRRPSLRARVDPVGE